MATIVRSTNVPSLVVSCWRAAVAAASIALVGNIVAVLERTTVYGSETRALMDVAIAQDVVTALVIFPAILVAARRAARGSTTAHLAGLGVIAFLTYNYAIYCFSISFGPLFLLWIAVLGLSTYALVTGFRGAAELDLAGAVRPSRTAGAVLIGVSVLFTCLWLSEIVPDLLAGRPSTSAEQWHVPTNPVHVLDLAFFLPSAFVVGFTLHARSRTALIAAPGLLVLMVLTCLPIATTPVVSAMLSHEASWGAVGPVLVIATLACAALRTMVLARRSGS
jgi:hypothetical protein